MQSYTVKMAVQKLREIQEENPTIGENPKIQNIIDMLDSPETLFIEWGVEDVIARAKEIQEDISATQRIPMPEEAQNILYSIGRRHDYNYGITWDTIDDHLSGIR